MITPGNNADSAPAHTVSAKFSVITCQFSVVKVIVLGLLTTKLLLQLSLTLRTRLTVFVFLGIGCVRSKFLGATNSHQTESTSAVAASSIEA